MANSRGLIAYWAPPPPIKRFFHSTFRFGGGLGCPLQAAVGPGRAASGLAGLPAVAGTRTHP